MPVTPINKLPTITTGTQIDTWGNTQTVGMNRIDDCLDGAVSFALNGTRTLVYANDSSDEAHYAVINITGGSGGTVIMQPTPGVYIVVNNASGNTIFQISGNSATQTIEPGVITVLYNDGVNVNQQGFGNVSVKAYIDAAIAAEHAFAQGLAFDSTGELPGQTGNAGKYLGTNGVSASWASVSQADVTGLQAALFNLQGFAIAAAAIL